MATDTIVQWIRLHASGLMLPNSSYLAGLDLIGGTTPQSGGMRMITLNVNGKRRNLDIPDDMPLLWALRDVLDMTGTKFGCGMGLCGACTIHIDGQPTRSCITPASAAAGRQITTIEAIGATPAGSKIQTRLARARRAAMRVLPVRPDHVCDRVAGEQTKPSDADIDEAMAGNICRCGTYRAHPRRNQAGRWHEHQRRQMSSPTKRFEMKSTSIGTRVAVSSSRRNFLKLTATAAIGSGLALGFAFPCAAR